MCICLKVPYIRRNSLQINDGVQFIVYHMWVHVHHMCVCLKVPYIRRNTLSGYFRDKFSIIGLSTGTNISNNVAHAQQSVAGLLFRGLRGG